MPTWFPDRKVWGSGLLGLAAFAIVMLGNLTGWWHLDYSAVFTMLGTIVFVVGASYQLPPSLRDRLRHLNDEVMQAAKLVPAPQTGDPPLSAGPGAAPVAAARKT